MSIRPDGLRVPDPGETFPVKLLLWLTAEEAAELFNAAFSPLSFGPTKLKDRALHLIAGNLEGQAVFFDPESWTIDAFFAEPGHTTLLGFLELMLHLSLRKL